MSLIDEALKRAQAAQQEEKEREEGARPWTPPPLPDRGRILRRRARAIAIVCLAVAALAVAAAVLLRHAHRRAESAVSAASAAVQSSSSAAGLPPITSEVTVAPPPRGVSFPAASAERAHTGTAPMAAAASAAPTSSAPARSVTSPVVSAARPEAGHPEARSEASNQKMRRPTEPRSYAGEMPLPGGGKVTLDGIVYSEANPVAVLNGRVVPPGGYVEGFTVVRILPDRVELDREGSRIFLTVR